MSLLLGMTRPRGSPPRRLIAVDFDESVVRLVEAVGTGRGRFEIAAAVEIPWPADLDANDALAVGRVLSEARQAGGIAAGEAATMLASHHHGWHALRLPSAPETDLWPMALMAARRDHHLDGMVIEFCTLPTGVANAASQTAKTPRSAPTQVASSLPIGSPAVPGVEVLAASVPQDYLARLRASLTAGDCPPSAIGLRSLALWRLWSQTYAPQAESVATLLEVGRSHSEIIITAGGRLLACRSVPVGWASQADHGDENPVDAIPMAESKTPDVIADNDSPDREDSLVGTSRTGLDFEKVPQTAAATAPDTTQGRSAPDPDTHKPDPQRWMAMLSAEVRRTLLAVSARHGSPLSVELHLLAGVEYRQAFAEHLGQTGFGVTALAPESQIAVRESARGVMSRGHHGALVGLCHQMLGDGGLPLDYQKPKIEEAERQLAEASRLRRLLIALAAVIALVAPLPFYMKARAELATRETTLAEYQRRTKDARQDAQKFKIFRAIWSDKPEGAVPAPLFDKVQAERKTLAVIKEQMAQRAALADDAQRASDTVAVVSGKLAVARYAGINRALAEVYTAADTAFGWGNGGLRGELLEFRLEPTPRSSLAGRAATSAEQASARVVVKGRADSSATAQRLADELTAGGGAVTALSMLPVNNPRERERRAVEFELRYQPQYKPGLVSPEALWDAARRAAIAKAAKPDPKMVAKPQTKTATKPNPTTALVASPENPASAKR